MRNLIYAGLTSEKKICKIELDVKKVQERRV